MHHYLLSNCFVSKGAVSCFILEMSVAADLGCWWFTSEPSRQQYDFLEKFSICWAIVVMLHCDWLSCFRAMRPVMWLAESIFINHHTLWSILHITQPFCTFIPCCTYMNQSSRCIWRRPHSAQETCWSLCLLYWNRALYLSRQTLNICGVMKIPFEIRTCCWITGKKKFWSFL